MKILFSLYFCFLGITTFAQQVNEAKQEAKTEHNAADSKNEQSTTGKAAKIKTVSAKDAERIPLVKPGKRTADPAKKD